MPLSLDGLIVIRIQIGPDILILFLYCRSLSLISKDHFEDLLKIFLEVLLLSVDLELINPPMHLQ